MKTKLRLISEYPRIDTRWLWYPYIPYGKVTTIDGDPGAGKSFVTCAIAASLSRGLPLPGQEPGGDRKPQKVLVLNAEDDPDDTLRGRLEDLGADLSKIAVPDETFVLDEDGIDEMREHMRAFAATVVIIDPYAYYIGSKRDMNKANEVRGLMDALKIAAKRSGSAVILVRHLAKGRSEDRDIYKGSGSIDAIAAVRSGLMVERGKNGERILKHIKANNGPLGNSLEFRIDEEGFHWEGFRTNEELEDILPQGGRTHPKEAVKRRKGAQDFLKEALRAGPVKASEIVELAEKAGISYKTLVRAKEGIAISVQREGFWEWMLDPELQEFA